MRRGAVWGTWIFLLSCLVLAVWSYSYTDPNLMFLSHPWYAAFQRWMWTWRGSVLSNTWLYVMSLCALGIGYTLLLQRSLTRWQKGILLLSGVALLVANNALSHDIFNYLFNAKMVVVYGANPHMQTALDFASDPWVRFMHNIHTPAPYGWMWTLLSLIPFAAGLGTFLLSWLAMKVWMAIGLVLLLFMLWRLVVHNQLPWMRWWSLALHPLLLIETLLNGHNDVWMMWPALGAVLLAHQWPQRRWKEWQLWAGILGAAGLLAFSISLKFVTVVLVPLFFLFLPRLPRIAERIRKIFAPWWADFAALALLLPLFTARSQQFHPWYLIWALSFWPLMRSHLLRSILLGLSFSSLFRYLPWMDAQLEYTPLVLLQQKFLTWSGALLGAVVFFWRRFNQERTE